MKLPRRSILKAALAACCVSVASAMGMMSKPTKKVEDIDIRVEFVEEPRVGDQMMPNYRMRLLVNGVEQACGNNSLILE